MTSLAIVIPLFNKGAFVGETIASLALQDEPPDALIVVDDASTDGSALAAERALAAQADRLAGTRVTLIRRDRNGGPGQARNDGIARADSDLLFCLDADDSLRPDALARVRAAMTARRLDLLVLGYASDPPGEHFPDLDALTDEIAPLGDSLFLLPFPMRTAAHPDFIMGRASNVAVRRARLAGHAFCTEARLNEGVDLWHRVLRAIVAESGRAGLCAEPLIRFRILPDSLSHRPAHSWRDLPPPPTLLRHADSQDPDDRAMAAMLAGRWVDHALELLPRDEQRTFLARHRPLLEGLGALPAAKARRAG
jgi:glycosyltransferase involved in cell wall biosynthesis